MDLLSSNQQIGFVPTLDRAGPRHQYPSFVDWRWKKPITHDPTL